MLTLHSAPSAIFTVLGVILTVYCMSPMCPRDFVLINALGSLLYGCVLAGELDACCKCVHGRLSIVSCVRSFWLPYLIKKTYTSINEIADRSMNYLKPMHICLSVRHSNVSYSCVCSCSKVRCNIRHGFFSSRLNIGQF